MAFVSSSNNLVPRDLNQRQDVFLAPARPLQVLTIGPIAPDPRNTGVSTVTVTFSKPADAGTFDFNDLVLTRDGDATNLIDASVNVVPLGGNDFEIQNLAPLTSAEGVYTLTVVAAGIDDLDGVGGIDSASDSWTVDTTPPVLNGIVPSPDPTNAPVTEVFVTFTEPIDLGTFDFTALTLERDSVPVPLDPSVTITLLIGSTYEIGNLGAFTAAEGVYTLTVSGANVDDLVGNQGNGVVADTWEQDFTPPQLTALSSVSPDPRSAPVDFIEATFSEPIDLATFTHLDVSLTLDGGSNLIDSSVTITHEGGTTYRINGLAPLTAADGNYVLTVDSTTIQDPAGNNGINALQESWDTDANGPSVLDVVDVTPDPRSTAVSMVVVEFSEDVVGFGVEDLSLTLNGGPNLIDGSVTITPLGGAQYEIGNLTAFTGLDGLYVLSVDAAGVQDALGNVGAGVGQDDWIKNEFGPVLISVGPVTPDPRNTPVSTVEVVFSGDLDLSTFDHDDITLTLNGGSDLIVDASTTIVQVGIGRYELGGNLSTLTAADGNYVLTVDGTGVTDAGAQPGSGVVADSWTMDTVAPAVDSFVAVSPDPRNAAVNSVDVVFTKPIDLATFDFNDVTLTLDGGANLITSSVTVASVGGNTYRIGGLAGLTAADGDYVLTVDSSGVQDLAGNAGTNSLAETWTVDATAPALVGVGPVLPDPTSTSVDEVDVEFTEPINLSTFDFNDVSLSLNGGPNLINNAVTVVQLTATTYRIGNLAPLTASDGTYVLTVNAVGVQDLVGNNGTGSANDDWIMSASDPSIISVGPVTPDPRNSAVSSVDVVLSEVIDLGTFDHADLSLTLDAGPELITPAVTVTHQGGTTAAFLLGGLRTLPGRNEEHSPLTLDLDEDVIVRAREGSEGRVTEIVLARSEHGGKPVRLQLNRELLARALSLGLHRLEIANPDTPIVCKDEKRTLVLMPLNKNGAVPPRQDAIRIVSTDIEPMRIAPKRRKSVNTNPSENGQGNGHASGNGDGQATSKPSRRRRKSAESNGLVEEAVALRTMLREACARSNALITALKKQKRQGKLLRSTIASLRQLQQAEGA